MIYNLYTKSVQMASWMILYKRNNQMELRSIVKHIAQLAVYQVLHLVLLSKVGIDFELLVI